MCWYASHHIDRPICSVLSLQKTLSILTIHWTLHCIWYETIETHQRNTSSIWMFPLGCSNSRTDVVKLETDRISWSAREFVMDAYCTFLSPNESWHSSIILSSIVHVYVSGPMDIYCRWLAQRRYSFCFPEYDVILERDPTLWVAVKCGADCKVLSCNISHIWKCTVAVEFGL